MATGSDASRQVDELQIRLLREAGLQRRFRMTMEMTRGTAILQRKALRRRHPELSDREIDLMRVALNYGDELARKVRAYLERRDGA